VSPCVNAPDVLGIHPENGFYIYPRRL